MIYTGKKVYDSLTNTYSTGYWIKDSKGYWYPVWREWGRKMIRNKRKLEKSLEIACELMNGSIIYGIDEETLFNKVMELEGYVSSWNIKDFILKNIDRFSDNEKERNKAIKRLGW